MAMQVVQAVSGVNTFAAITGIGTTAVQVFDNTAGRERTQRIQYFRITNTHASNILYVGFGSGVLAAGPYAAALTAGGGFIEFNVNGASDTFLGSIYVIGSAAATTMTLTTLV